MAVAKTIEEARKRVKILVRRFNAVADEYTRSGSTYNETALRTEFLNPLLEALGWDVTNESGQTQDAREVIYEANLADKEEKLSRRPDYEMRLARQRKFYTEAKKPSVNIETDKASAFQTRRYGFSAGLPMSILVNFNHIAVYDCTHVPKDDDEPHVARLRLYKYDVLEENLGEIWDSFSREAIYTGRFDEKYKVDLHRQGTSPFDQFFLKQVRTWREKLALDICNNNSGLTSEQLTYIVQRFINRIVFLRICEDRDLEKYESLKSLDKPKAYTKLKKLLGDADKKYNSGLFDLIDDSSMGVDVGDDTLLSIIAELYYPKSPYTFAVVDPAVLGDIYELFIAHEIHVTGRGVDIVEKPEVKASGGVATTPRYVVDQIISRTMTSKIQGKSPKQLNSFTLADIACGSGVFLLRAYQFLIDHYINCYVSNGPGRHTTEMYEVGQGQYRLKLHEKRRILLAHIYGVDIDPQAVEVARFSLLLKLIEDESSESITAHQVRFKEAALPPLDDHVVCGNSLVDHAHLTNCSLFPVDDALLAKLNPLDWRKEFPGIEGKFDVIVGNPPYIRIQNMVGYSPEEVKFYQDPASGYACAKADNFDKYNLFVERGLELLRPSGRLGFILPHKFFTLQSGEALRTLIARGKYLDQIVYFGVQQVFGKSSTYTCILVLEKSQQPDFTVEHVTDLNRWRYGEAGDIKKHLGGEIGSGQWSFVPGAAKLLFDRIKKGRRTLSEVAEIFVGVQTSQDKIYIFHPEATTKTTLKFTDIEGDNWEIERTATLPSLLDVPLEAFTKPNANSVMIFPYQITSTNAVLYTPKEMKSRFPGTWDYLNAHKPKLKDRSIMNGTPATWYRFGRSQSLTKFNTPKLILPILSTESKVAYDDTNIVVTGGGNGPYYLLRPRENEKVSIYFLQAILCHPVMEAMIRSIASPFRGGYYSHGKQFIKDIPIAAINFNDPSDKKAHDSIVHTVEALIKNNEARKAAKTPRERTLFDRQRAALIDQVQDLVSEMYGIAKADLEVAKSVQIPT